MDYKLLSVSKLVKKGIILSINIGDYIQALAASQYLPMVNGFLDRDEDLKKYYGEECAIIMNGWYMHQPLNWPPSERIHPLFVSIHINNSVQECMFSKESISYFKKYEPIGCRDLNTMEALEKNGVKAYFSGCMTLTLGKTYIEREHGNDIYIVDPIYNGRLTILNLLNGIFEIISHPNDICNLYSNPGLNLTGTKSTIKRFIITALFYREYSNFFGRNIIRNSTYICHQGIMYDRFESDEELLKEAERLVKMYAKARLVITSRIHCALPCLGLETPVVYLDNKQSSIIRACRLNGLRDLFNVITVSNGKLLPEFKMSKKPLKVFPSNKDNWKVLASTLDKRCVDFINKWKK